MTNTRTHVFAVGLGRFQKVDLPPVDHVDESVRAVVEAWHSTGLDEEDVALLLNEEATKTAVESRLRRWSAAIGEGDTAVLLYAGRGFDGEGGVHLLAYDSQPDDLEFTSLALAEVLRSLERGRARKLILFLDPEEGLDVRQLDMFGRDRDRVAYVSCSPGEFSRASAVLKQRLWLHALGCALNGEGKNLGTKELRGDLLQEHLRAEVSRLLRSRRDGNERQTPLAFGRLTDLIVTELKADESLELEPLLHDSRLLGERFGRVRSLGGFQKKRGHREPDRHSEAAANFIRKIGVEEIGAHAADICGRLRDAFAYRRADLLRAEGDGAVTIKTPDFDVDVWLEQDPDESVSYRLVTEIMAFRDPRVAADESFDRAFTGICDTLVIEFACPFPVAEKIDQLETDPELGELLEYDGGDSFVLRLSRPPMRVVVSAERMEMRLAGGGGLGELLRNAMAAMQTLNRSIGLLPDVAAKG